MKQEIMRSNISIKNLMPGNLHARNLDDDLIARLKRRSDQMTCWIREVPMKS